MREALLLLNAEAKNKRTAGLPLLFNLRLGQRWRGGRVRLGLVVRFWGGRAKGG